MSARTQRRSTGRMLAGLVIGLTRAMLFGIVSLSAIISIYAATNAMAVSTNLSVFTSGLVMVAAAVVVNPLFCFLASYGLVRYSDVPLILSLVLTLPACLAWCVAVGRALLGDGKS